MDSDAMNKKMTTGELQEFRTGKIDILVGTQIIAKGLHFPNVTLVGIVNAELHCICPISRGRTDLSIVDPGGRSRWSR